MPTIDMYFRWGEKYTEIEITEKAPLILLPTALTISISVFRMDINFRIRDGWRGSRASHVVHKIQYIHTNPKNHANAT